MSNRFRLDQLFEAETCNDVLLEQVVAVVLSLLETEFKGRTSLVQLARHLSADHDVDALAWADGLQRVLAAARHPDLEMKRPRQQHNEFQAALIINHSCGGF
jgi:hypothetical protein